MAESYNCRRVREDDDKAVLAHLIYHADPYLYPGLFGSEEAAVKVLDILMLNPRSIFYYKNYCVVELDGRIVAMGAFYKNNPKWNPEVLKNAFYESQMKIPPSFDSASQYFMETFNELGVGFNACNIVVDEDYRRRGIATALLMYIRKLSGNSPIELNVICDNEPAVNMYLRNGFVIVDEFDDYGGYMKPPIRCYKMLTV